MRICRSYSLKIFLDIMLELLRTLDILQMMYAIAKTY